jgi:hypothetical protein
VLWFFRAVVARLAETGILLDDASRTNREHQRDLRRRPVEAGAFARATPPFERVRYGSREATPEDASLAREAADVVFRGAVR